MPETVQANYEAAEQAWLESKKATVKATEAAQKAKLKWREAETHLQKMHDAQREAWVAMKDAEWVHTYSKSGEWLSTQRFPEGKPATKQTAS